MSEHNSAQGIQRPSLQWLGSAMLLALGIWLFVLALWPVLQHWHHDYTLPVRAQVVESRIEPLPPWRVGGDRPTFSYRYFHQGQLFKSSAYRPGGHLDEAVRSYPPGAMLTTYLDPQRPQYAMVWPQSARPPLETLSLGVLLILLALRSGSRRDGRAQDQAPPTG